MRIVLLLLFVNIASFNLYAHDPREAFFQIEQKESSVEIHAEFPWTIRNALLTYQPALSEATDKVAYENALFDYVQSTILLKNTSGQLLELIKVNELENIGHSHQNNFIFIFRGNHLAELSNEIMFNISDQQTNYHIIEVEGERMEFLTSVENSGFGIREMERGGVMFWVIGLLGLVVVFVFFRGMRKVGGR